MIKITFNKSLTKTNPETTSVLIIGTLTNLIKVGFQSLQSKLKPKVTEEVFKEALNKLKINEMCSLYLNSILITVLPFKCSRHNTPSRAHTLTRLVQAYVGKCDNKNIVIVCEYTEVFASACAVVRAFPFFDMKTDARNQQISVEFVVISSRKASSSSSDSSHDVIELSDEDITALDYAATGISLAARITDAPCNEMNVDNFLQEIQNIGSQLHVKPVIIRGKQLAEKGFGGIWSVGQAAIQSPALVVLSYTPSGAKTTIAWVGKGIVFDSGGLCLKSKTEMLRMKHDCGGAAAILGAFYAVVRSNFSQNLHAIFCLAENAIGPLAVRPEDIYTLYSGRTVEIINTDAEGRLVLADGAAYAKRILKADIILDMATLTGAQGITTGYYHAAVLTNNENWEDYCMKAGRASGDLVFPVLYSPELHFREYDSACADMRNCMIHGNNASCSCAGLFINAHLGFDFPGVWIHIDMAATVRSTDRATGYGVALLCTLFGCYCRQPMLNAISPQFGSRESLRRSKSM